MEQTGTHLSVQIVQLELSTLTVYKTYKGPIKIKNLFVNKFIRKNTERDIFQVTNCHVEYGHVNQLMYYEIISSKSQLVETYIFILVDGSILRVSYYGN